MNFTLPQNTIFYQIEKALKRYRKLAQATINGAGYDVSINQVILLLNLRENPDASQVELSELVFKDFASIVRMTDLMVKKGFITRIENKIDRRKKDLILTKKGNKMLDKVTPLVQSYRQTALEGFSSQVCDNAMTFLIQLSKNCELALEQLSNKQH